MTGGGRTVVAVLIALVVGSVCGAVVGGSGHSSSSQPSGAVSSADLAAQYATTAKAQFSQLEADDAAISNACGGGNDSACKSALQASTKDTQSFLDDIGALEIPACLSATNEQLSTALELMIDGDNKALAGIAASDASEIEAGATLINLATTHLNASNDLLSKVTCS